MPAPFFTIVIVVFNGEKTLQRAINSIVQQTYTDYELMIVDGLSTDGTISIVRENASKNPRIRFVSEKDEGIYDAMNKAISLSNGNWLYFLGCDDWLYEKDILEKVALNASSGKYNMIYGDIFLLPERKKYGGDFSKEKLFIKNISHQAIFYNKDVFQKLGVYNLSYKTHADWDYNIRCFQSGAVIHHHIDLIISYFVKGGTSSKQDQPFLKGSLFSHFTNEINSNPKFIGNVIAYDAYWRLIRNAEIRDKEHLNTTELNNHLPNVTIRIIKLQKIIPKRLLKIGLFSKFFMVISYLQNKISVLR